MVSNSSNILQQLISWGRQATVPRPEPSTPATPRPQVVQPGPDRLTLSSEARQQLTVDNDPVIRNEYPTPKPSAGIPRKGSLINLKV